MKLSVIIPIYNVENYLERCLESIVNQDMSDVEIILVNDGSTDNSKKICQVYEKKFSNIKLLNKKNSGTGESRNLGLEIAEGEYIYFCDPDDYIETDLFNNISKMINSNQDVYMFGYWNEIEYDGRIVSSTESCVFKNKSYTRVDFLESFSELFCTNMLYTLWNKVYKKTFLKNNNIIFSNSPMGQDTRFNINVYRYINSFEVIRKSYYHYTILREGSSTTKYRHNRIDMKIEENLMLAKLVTDFNIPHKEALLRRTREDILLDCSNHIVYSNLTNKEKKIELNRIMMTFRKQFQNFDFNNTKITTKLLQRNHVNMYILLKKIQKRIRIYRYKKMLN